MAASTLRRTAGRAETGRVVRLFDGNHAAIGPGVSGHRVQRSGQIADAHGEVLAARGDGTQHSARAQLAGVGVGLGDMQRGHVLLHREVGVLPLGEAGDGHVAALGGWRDQVQLLARGVDRLRTGGWDGGARRRALAARKQHGRCSQAEGRSKRQRQSCAGEKTRWRRCGQRMSEEGQSYARL